MDKDGNSDQGRGGLRRWGVWNRKRQRDSQFRRERDSDTDNDSDHSDTPPSPQRRRQNYQENNPPEENEQQANIEEPPGGNLMERNEELSGDGVSGSSSDDHDMGAEGLEEEGQHEAQDDRHHGEADSGSQADSNDGSGDDEESSGDDHLNEDEYHDREGAQEADVVAPGQEVEEGLQGLDFVAEDNNQHHEDLAGVDTGSEPDGSSDDQSGNSSNSDQYTSAEENASTEEEDEDEDEGEFNYDDEPIFNGANITFRESSLAILCFILSHKLTGLCINDLLKLISLLCGPGNLLLQSLFRFKKYFKMIGKDYVRLHYFCSVCQDPLPSKDSFHCGSHHHDSYFIQFPLVNQLQHLFSKPGFYEKLQFRFNRQKKNVDNIEEIYDGLIYQALFASGFLNNPNNVSFFMYFDGVSIFKSSNFSIWPIFLTVNELKYKDRTRKDNTILAGLWFGKKKPNPNIFLSPLRDELELLENNGVDVRLPDGEVIRVRGKLIGAVADMPAKSLFMRFMQYNGAFSCFNCMAQGGRFEVGTTTIQVFPYSRDLELRNNEETIEFAEQALAARALDRDASVYGVKGPSYLSSMLPNMILCMGIDVMHGIFLGVMRTVLHLWFDGQYSQSPFSISNLVLVVDARLKRIKPPYSFQSMPRSIKKDIAHWKAFDLKVFFFYYSLVVLVGVLPERYWIHHAQLVTAVSLLCQESISQQQIECAEEMLHSYVSDFQRLYGLRHLTLTFHQLLHLPMVCKNLGPAWVFSCFCYESLNGQLARLVHGSRYVALQICSSSAIFMKSRVLINDMNEGEAKDLCLKLLSRSQQKVQITENIDFQTGIVGKVSKQFNPPANIRRLLQEQCNIIGGRHKYFLRLKRKGLVYTSQAYTRSKQKKSFYVEIFDDNVPHLCRIISFIRWSSCDDDCNEACAECESRYFCLVSLYAREMWELHDAPLNTVPMHLQKISDLREQRIFDVCSIRSQCVYMPVTDNDEYIGVPINNLEVE